MKAIKHIYTLLAAACMMLAASCTKEPLVDNSNIESGIPVTARFSLTVPGASEISVTRAGMSHSDIGSLEIFIYDQFTGEFEDAVTAEVVRETTGSAGNSRTYEVKFKATTGSKTLLGIANGSEMSEWAANIAGLKQKKLSLSDMRNEVINLQNALIETLQLPGFATSHMLLIGQQDVKIERTGNITGDNLMLYRAAVEVKFEITNGQMLDSDGNMTPRVMDFNPSTYKVYNVPKGTKIGSGQFSTNADGYYNTEAFVAPPENDDMYSFTFYMPENIQPQGANNTYAERELWTSDNIADNETTAPEQKTWTYAPQHSTFVVITGAFNATENGVLEETGMVSYTIHLGDFTENPANYSIERNSSYTYKIKINGVNNIIAEAERRDEGDWQQGAEGGVILVNNRTQDYTLDAHYEQVFLEYNITDMANAINVSSDNDEELREAIGKSLLLIVETPFTKRGTDYINPYASYLSGQFKTLCMMAVDYNWVEFLPQAENDILKVYPGKKGVGESTKTIQIDSYDLSVALGRAIYDFKTKGRLEGTGVDKIVYKNEHLEDEGGGIIIVQNTEGDYVARFTTFVDEYYYRETPEGETIQWSDFVNTNMRRMMLAMDVQTSTDQNSQAVTLYSNISQRSIQTFYDLSKAEELDGFGIEAFNETPGTRNYGNPVRNGISMGNGYVNTLLMIGGDGNEDGSGYSINGVLWNRFVNWDDNGYMQTNTSTDVIASHKLPDAQPGENLAYRACMSRNRDLNGNGTIDLDEVRWYMPSVHEYIRIALGSGAIASESQLYHGQVSELTYVDYPKAFAKDASLYYTSSSGSGRMYYTVEKGSYSSDWGNYDPYGPSAVRCIRHLPNPDGSVVTTPDPFYTLKTLGDKGNYLLDYTGILQANLLRQTVQNEGYDEHHDNDLLINRFPKGMVVAKDYIRNEDIPESLWISEGERPEVSDTEYAQLVSLFSFERVTTGTDVCQLYYAEEANRSDLGGWRTPNQVELTSMSSRPERFFKDAGVDLKTSHHNYPEMDADIFGETVRDDPDFKADPGEVLKSRLWGALSRTKFSNQLCRYGFAFRGSVLSCPEQHGASAASFPHFRGGVRCVRDATETEMSSATEVNP